jgi:tetratricopeptide (TPR) repeat protein
VFDNCEDEALLEGWRPRAGGCRVLVTSRRDTWSPHLGVQEVSLDVLPRPEGVALLRKHRPDLAPDHLTLNAVAAELGDLPLALHLAGSYLARYRHTPFGQPAAYLEAVQRPNLLDHRSLTIEGESRIGHAQHVARSFALSYDQLRPADAIDAMALVTLARAAWFAPGEAIPREPLRASAGVDGEDENGVLRFEDGIARLRELGLIADREAGALVLHRLLAAFVRSEAGEEATHRGQVEAAVLAEARSLNHTGYPGPLLAWQPQLRFVAEQAAAAGSEHAGSLLVNLGYHLNLMAVFYDARAAFERSLEIDEARLGPNHPDIALRVNNLGDVLQNLGDLAGAKAAYERALRIFEKFLPAEPPNIATVRENLGNAIKEQEQSASRR